MAEAGRGKAHPQGVLRIVRDRRQDKAAWVILSPTGRQLAVAETFQEALSTGKLQERITGWRLVVRTEE